MPNENNKKKKLWNLSLKIFKELKFHTKSRFYRVLKPEHIPK